MPSDKPVPERFADIARSLTRLTSRVTSCAPVQQPIDRAFADLGEHDYDEIAAHLAAIANTALEYLGEAGWVTDAALGEVAKIAGDLDDLAALRRVRRAG